jgi:hypothetical protein
MILLDDACKLDRDIPVPHIKHLNDMGSLLVELVNTLKQGIKFIKTIDYKLKTLIFFCAQQPFSSV